MQYFACLRVLSKLVSSFLWLTGFGQTITAEKCCGTTASNYPFNTGAQRTQLWYNPSNFTSTIQNGVIDTIYFRSTTAAQTATYTNLKISLHQPPWGTGFAGTSFLTGMTEVLNEVTFQINGSSVSGSWFAIPLTTSFAYNRENPLVVELVHTGFTGSGIETYSSAAPGAAIQKLYAASATANGGAPSNSTWQDFGFHLSFPPCPVPLLASGNYTINRMMPTTATNFNSFNDAIAAMQCGINGPVTFHVVPGTGPYLERVVIPEVAGASAVNTITIHGHGETLEYSSPTLANRSAILLQNADHIIVDSLKIMADGGQYGFGIHLTGHADSNTIRNCTIVTSKTTTTANEHTGILVDAVGNRSPAYNSFFNNSIIGGYYSIRMQGNTSNDTANYQNGNRIINNRLMDSYFAGISLSGVKRAHIAGNDISRPTRTNIGNTWDGVNALTSWALMIENNRVHNVFDATPNPVNNTFRGLFMYTSSYNWNMPSTLRNNIIYNIRSRNSVTGIYIIGGYYEVYHNTIILNDTAAQSAGSMTAFGQLNSGESRIRNNIFFLRRNSPAAKAVYSFTGSFSGTPIINNNIAYTDFAGGTNSVSSYKSVNYTTWNDWTSAFGGSFDQQSVFIDPQFVSEDLPIPLSAGVQDTGAAVGVVHDINGVIRSTSKPDPGAFENAGIYIFVGNGSWHDPANWMNNKVPPSVVPAGYHIIINPAAGGSCTFTGTLTISRGSVLKATAGVQFHVNGNIEFL
jgi:hypothetical protein